MSKDYQEKCMSLLRDIFNSLCEHREHNEGYRDNTYIDFRMAQYDHEELYTRYKNLLKDKDEHNE